MAKLFGFSIEAPEKKAKSIASPIPPNNQDGVDNYISSGFYGQFVDIEGVYKTEHDLIKRYREMAIHPETDNAIEDVVNEAIVSDLYDSPIEIELSNVNASDKLKSKIREEFKYIKELLDFDKKSHEIFRNWYVDGRLYYHKLIDLKNPEEGIKELRYIDPMKMKFIRQEKKDKNKPAGIDLGRVDESSKTFYPEIEEYFIYTPKPNYPMGMISGAGGQKGVKIAKDAITYINSGLVDRNRGTVLSYLHKAIKALNQLRMIEDSLVIYRLSRAPERRIFYIDVGNLPKVKAEQYLKEVMSRYRNKLVYDASTGEVRDDRKFMSMLEDFWLPRREGGRGTEDWDEINDHIQYDFLYDNQFAELKESELMDGRLATLAAIEPYIGKYYSAEYIRRKVLRQTDTEMVEIDEQIEKEIAEGIIPDPSMIDPITGEPLPPEGGMMDAPPLDTGITNGQVQKDTKTAEI